MAQDLLFLENAECECTCMDKRKSACIEYWLTAKAGKEQTGQVTYALVSLLFTAAEVLFPSPINHSVSSTQLGLEDKMFTPCFITGCST